MRTLLIIPTLILAAAGASADTLSKQLRACAAIEASDKRLACYDTLSGTLDQRAEQNFGQEQLRITEDAPDTIEAAIADISKTAYNKALITLDNGQVWRQNDSTRLTWKVGDAVVLERGLLGSFFMKQADGGRKIRVKRIR
ncbi:hypothetical protein Q2E61_07075 [Microbulbifer thermotolerans]|uniref:hypothetical protein n=1 Tax=Microbulbifer thermotolerans TaxID=252514 RepID=UPI002671543D|nr:hypothetical protein [Microbulbifer thermotolerans]WKT61953.1 hypothetical protein Q2E61_07075 [Microbulbifer thermotolerans]